jgi:cytochrome P450
MLHGKFIPEGTVIGVNCWVVNRDKSIFGQDADSFRPERWIDSDPADITKMRTNMFTVRIPKASVSPDSHVHSLERAPGIASAKIWR